jgi:cytochrome c peroxidase
MTVNRIFLAVALGCILVSCEKQLNPDDALLGDYLDLPKTPYKYDSDKFNDLQIQLGRVLFYDPKLSDNNTVSCGSCHKQQYAFGDNVSLSKGLEGGLTLRNTLPLVDARQASSIKVEGSSSPQQGGLFWDGRSSVMHEAVMQPIFNQIEMGMDWDKLTRKLKEVPYYPILFTRAFGQPEIEYVRVQDALAAFVGTMQSNSSRFERSLSGLANLSLEEQKGAALFAGKYRCGDCHQGHFGKLASSEYQTVAEFANIGLDKTYGDKGLELTTRLSSDEGRFRVPNLSNVAITAPYMHDGRFTTLEEVIDHYSSGIASHPNLDSRLKTVYGTPARFAISAEEKKALVAFLKTFTDDDVATNFRLANPFKESGN